MTLTGPGLLARGSPAAPAVDAGLDAWLAWLEAGRGEHIELGLERCHEVASRLALGRPAPVVVTVAGTNGKGSSVALLEHTWRCAGYRVGAYTSPHLVRYNERMRIAGIPLGDAPICAAFARVEAARGEVPLTYFEFATLAALSLFAAAELDVAVLEVGLGGRLDAVNIIDADVAPITAIGLDHEDWLGNTRDSIAREKRHHARRPTRRLLDHAVPATLLESAREVGAALAVLGVDFGFDLGADGWTWRGTRVHADLPPPALAGHTSIAMPPGCWPWSICSPSSCRYPTPRCGARCAKSVCRGASNDWTAHPRTSWMWRTIHKPPRFSRPRSPRRRARVGPMP